MTSAQLVRSCHPFLHLLPPDISSHSSELSFLSGDGLRPASFPIQIQISFRGGIRVISHQPNVLAQLLCLYIRSPLITISCSRFLAPLIIYQSYNLFIFRLLLDLVLRSARSSFPAVPEPRKSEIGLLARIRFRASSD